MIGYGHSHGHHGEILQGAVTTAADKPRPVLVTLPCLAYESKARFRLSSRPDLRVYPPECTKALTAARLTLDELDMNEWGGTLWLDSNITPLQGLGSSTADVTAAVRAVADTCGACLPSAHIARIAVMAETASDPLMFGTSPILFAQREGLVLECFEQALPSMVLLSLRDPRNGPGTSTLALNPHRHESRALTRYEGLLNELRAGIATNNLSGIAAVATNSALINQSCLHKPRLESLLALGYEHGASGIQIAHSGSVMGLIFEPCRLQALHETRQSLSMRYPDIKSEIILPDALCSSSHGDKLAVQTAPIRAAVT